MESNTTTANHTPAQPPVQASESRKNISRDLLIKALADSEPLDANIGAINAQLGEINYRFNDLVLQALEGPFESTTELDDMLPHIDRVVKLTNISERLSSWIVKRKSKQAELRLPQSEESRS